LSEAQEQEEKVEAGSIHCTSEEFTGGWFGL